MIVRCSKSPRNSGSRKTQTVIMSTNNLLIQLYVNNCTSSRFSAIFCSRHFLFITTVTIEYDDLARNFIVTFEHVLFDCRLSP
jgi:hypothetical protein